MASDKDKFACCECGRLYTKSALKVHLVSHTDELPFRCVQCGRSFLREQDRTAHIQQLHASRIIVKENQ